MAYNSRGAFRQRQGRYDAALADFHRAIDLDDQVADSFFNRGVIWLFKGQIDKALADYDQAIELNDHHIQAYSNRGTALQLKGKYDEALEDFDRAIRIAPNSPGGYNNRAWFYATCGDERHRNGQQALEDATKACELSNWKNPTMIDTLAAAYAEAGDFENAIKWQKRAIELIASKDGDTSGMEKQLKMFESGKPVRQ